MPLKDSFCSNCNKIEELLVKMDCSAPPVCTCGSERTFMISKPARTAGLWGDSSGGYDFSLGRSFSGSREKEKYLRDNGLVAVSDLGSGFLDQKVHEEIEAGDNHRRDVEVYGESLKKHNGDKGAAMADTFSVDVLKQRGLLDSDVAG